MQSSNSPRLNRCFDALGKLVILEGGRRLGPRCGTPVGADEFAVSCGIRTGSSDSRVIRESVEFVRRKGGDAADGLSCMKIYNWMFGI